MSKRAGEHRRPILEERVASLETKVTDGFANLLNHVGELGDKLREVDAALNQDGIKVSLAVLRETVDAISQRINENAGQTDRVLRHLAESQANLKTRIAFYSGAVALAAFVIMAAAALLRF